MAWRGDRDSGIHPDRKEIQVQQDRRGHASEVGRGEWARDKWAAQEQD